MPVSGLVLVCSDATAALRELRGRQCLTIGAEQGAGRVPVVLDTETHETHRAELAWLRQLPGVSLVELAYADYRAGGAAGGGSPPLGADHRVDHRTEELTTDGG